jgi:hypothetical protein
MDNTLYFYLEELLENGAKENRTLPSTLQVSIASLGTCGPEHYYL